MRIAPVPAAVALGVAVALAACSSPGGGAGAASTASSAPAAAPSPTPVTLPAAHPAPAAAATTVDVGDKPCALTPDGDGVWVTLYGANQVVRLDAAGHVRRRLTTGMHPCGVAVAAGLLWVADVELGRLEALDRTTGRAVRTVDVGGQVWDLRSDGTHLWTDDHARTLLSVDPADGRVRRVDVGNTPGGIAVRRDGVWVALQGDGGVARVDPATLAVTARVATGPSPTWFSDDGTALWVSDDSGLVQRLDPDAARVGAGLAVGGLPNDGAALDGRVYAPDRRDGRLLVLDAAGAAVRAVLTLPRSRIRRRAGPRVRVEPRLQGPIGGAARPPAPTVIGWRASRSTSGRRPSVPSTTPAGPASGRGAAST